LTRIRGTFARTGVPTLASVSTISPGSLARNTSLARLAIDFVDQPLLVGQLDLGLAQLCRVVRRAHAVAHLLIERHPARAAGQPAPRSVAPRAACPGCLPRRTPCRAAAAPPAFPRSKASVRAS
jgi:hypothetical protein